MSLAATVKAMVDAGCSPAQILAVVQQTEVSREAAVATRRAKDAERQRRKRHAESRDVTRTSAESADSGVAKKGLPHTPSKENPSFTIVQEGIHPEREVVDDLFAEFWEIYPKREGGNPKKPARTKFIAALKRDKFENILAGARAYAASREGDDPRFTAQAITWLHQDRWRDDHLASPSRAPPRDQTSPLTRAVQNIARKLNDQQSDRSNVIEIIPPGAAAFTDGRGDWPDDKRAGAGGPLFGNPRGRGPD